VATVGDRNKFGTYHRDQTGLDYADQRFYNSAIGRFLTSDPYEASGGAEEPGSWRRGGYVGGDPISFSDPRGLYRIDCSGGCLEAPPEYGGGILWVGAAAFSGVAAREALAVGGISGTSAFSLGYYDSLSDEERAQFLQTWNSAMSAQGFAPVVLAGGSVTAVQITGAIFITVWWLERSGVFGAITEFSRVATTELLRRAKEVWRYRSPNDRDRICDRLEAIQKGGRLGRAAAEELGIEWNENTRAEAKKARKQFECDTKEDRRGGYPR